MGERLAPALAQVNLTWLENGRTMLGPKMPQGMYLTSTLPKLGPGTFLSVEKQQLQCENGEGEAGWAWDRIIGN